METRRVATGSESCGQEVRRTSTRYTTGRCEGRVLHIRVGNVWSWCEKVTRKVGIQEGRLGALQLLTTEETNHPLNFVEHVGFSKVYVCPPPPMVHCPTLHQIVVSQR